MTELIKRGGIEFLAVFLGIALSLWVDQYKKSKEDESLNNQILSRLYDNLKADSVDAAWNSNAHRAAMIGSKKVSNGVMMINQPWIQLIFLSPPWQLELFLSIIKKNTMP